MSTSPPSSRKGVEFRLLRWAIWAVAVAFFFYEFLLRVFPSVMVDPLMKAFLINAETVGIISGLYFYVYAPMQFPVGVLMDRFGAHNLLAFAAFICGIGGILFGMATHIEMLAVARLIIGFASSFAFVGMVYITSRWFPRKRMALLIGIANSIAMLGAVSGEGPLSLLENLFGWRMSAITLGIIGIVLSFLILILVRNKPQDKTLNKQSESFLEAGKSLIKVIRNPYTWLNAFVGLFIYATTSSFAALWGVSYLEFTHGLTRSVAGFATSLIYVGWMIGGPLVGHFSDQTGRRRPFMIICPLLAFLAFLPLILFLKLPLLLTLALLVLIGFFSSAELLCFSYAIELHPSQATGSALAFTNFAVMLGGAFFQPFIGYLLDLFWSGGFYAGIKTYSARDYRLAVLCLPLTFLIATLLAFFLKETGKKAKLQEIGE